MLEYMASPIISVKQVWEDINANYSKYKTILENPNAKKYFINCEKSYNQVYKTKKVPLQSQEYKQDFEESIYNTERKFLITNLINEDRRCVVCGNYLRNNIIECDHILNKSQFRDFSFIPKNIAIVCHGCNHSKGSKNNDGIFNPYINNFAKEKKAIHFIFSFTPKLDISINYPSKLKPIFEVYKLEQTIEDDAFNRLRMITANIMASYNAGLPLTTDSLRNALNKMKNADILLQKYKAEYYNGSFIDDLLQNLDAFLDYIKEQNNA